MSQSSVAHLKGIIIRDVVASIKEGFFPENIPSDAKLVANVSLTVGGETSISKHLSEDDLAPLIENESGNKIPEYLPKGCQIKIRAVYELGISISYSDGSEDENIGKYACIYEVSYVVQEQINGIEDFDIFVRKQSLPDTWPYFREHAENSVAWMGIPGISISFAPPEDMEHETLN